MQVSQPAYIAIGIKDNQIESAKTIVKKHIAIEIILNLLFGKSSELYKELYDEGTIYSTSKLRLRIFYNICTCSSYRSI